jgi:hydrogenase maturation protein HypF
MPQQTALTDRDSVPAGQRRVRVDVTGVVQGVGFRPFVYALAHRCRLSGSVWNCPTGVQIMLEGAGPNIDDFLPRLQSDAPPLARVESISIVELRPCGEAGFTIVESDASTAGRTLVAPDVATCPDCLRELADPADRRYRHPFISCTNCGPRFTIITDLPYDRPNTTMARLSLCPRCASEYADAGDRRFHAQTIACHDCGPTLRLVCGGEQDRIGADAIDEARQLLAGGAIVAVKGIGGYHLACNADDENAVATLRKRKDRGDKPFAVMVGSAADAERVAFVGADEHAALMDARRPVVLLRRRVDAPLAPSVAPDHPDVGVLLAYTPLHHLLLGLPGDRPGPTTLVMTSANLAGEPIVTDDEDARRKLAGLADAWLMHDRAIAVPCDDSVIRFAAGQVLPVRRSRGYAPLPVALPREVCPALAVGGDQKNTFCVADGRHAWMSAHVGDMDDLATLSAFERATGHLARLTAVAPELIVADAHPRYRSTAWARRNGSRVRLVQHHHAHIAAALADNGHDGSRRVIGFAFDGTGYGTDGAVWGGEVLLADYDGFERAAHLSYVPLPGGDAAVRNPYRMALSHLRAAGVEWAEQLPSVAACPPEERRVLEHQLGTGLGCVPTSSMGRLFDAASSLAGVCHRIAYEAEAAMRFEELARDALGGSGPGYRFARTADEIRPAPVIAALAADVRAGVDPAIVAARFHRAVANAVVDAAVALRGRTGISEVALSGGVFLNAVLTELCRAALLARGFTVLTHRQVPPSDAGLALGQLLVGARPDSQGADARCV